MSRAPAPETLREYASFVRSGDHAGWLCRVVPEVSWMAPPPRSEKTNQIFALLSLPAASPRPEAKTIGPFGPGSTAAVAGAGAAQAAPASTPTRASRLLTLATLTQAR